MSLFVAGCPLVEEGALCDDDIDNDGDGRIDCADTNCILAPECARCGNGVVDEDSEACDDGNLDDDDGCSSTCLLESCGNATVDPGEQCDDGNPNGLDACDFACRIDRCGDFTLNAREECDDGNRRGGDGCSSRCRLEDNARCGDGRFQPGEGCDDGNRVDGDGCSSSCQAEFCGDGRVQVGRGEECEPPDGVRCDFSCRRVRCGDGSVDPAFFEQCDDGNRVDGDGCSSSCRFEVCGDGVVSGGEQCDDANAIVGDGCNAECRREFCGDDVRQARLGELCDGDVDCNASCRVVEACVGFSGDLRACFDVDDASATVGTTFASIQDRGAGVAKRAWLSSGIFSQAQTFELVDGDLVPVFVQLPRQVFLAAAFDLAGDARSELVVATFDATIAVLDDQLREAHAFQLGSFPLDIDVGDVGRDAAPDVVAVTNQRQLVVLFDPFDAPQNLSLGLPRGASSVVVAEGRVFYASDETLVVVRVDGVNPVEEAPIELPGRIADLVRVDVTGDGRDDVVALVLSPDQLMVLELDGVPPEAFDVLTPLDAGDRLQVGDIDGDLSDDIIVSRQAGLVQILFAQDGFAPSTTIPAPFSASTAGVADADGDGDADLVVGGGFAQGQALFYSQQ